MIKTRKEEIMQKQIRGEDLDPMYQVNISTDIAKSVNVEKLRRIPEDMATAKV